MRVAKVNRVKVFKVSSIIQEVVKEFLLDSNKLRMNGVIFRITTQGMERECKTNAYQKWGKYNNRK